MWRSEQPELDFFDKARSETLKRERDNPRRIKDAPRFGGKEEEEEINPPKPDLFIACTGKALPLDKEAKQRALENFLKLTPLDLTLWLARHTINEKFKGDIKEEDGPYFHAYVKTDSSQGAAQRFYSTIGKWDESGRSKELRSLTTELQRYARETDFGTPESRTILEEVEFTHAPYSERVRIGVQCIGKPTGKNYFGGPTWDSGIQYLNIERKAINEIFWIQSIIQRKRRTTTPKGEERISYQFIFCVADLDSDIDGSGKRFEKMWYLKQRADWVWLDASSELSKITREMKIPESREVVRKDLMDVIERFEQMKKAHELQMAAILKAYEELLEKIGVRGNIGMIEACHLFAEGGSYDEKGAAIPANISKCIEQKLKSDIFRQKIAEVALLRQNRNTSGTNDELSWVDSFSVDVTGSGKTKATNPDNYKGLLK